MQAKSKRRRQSWPSHQTTPDADSGEIYLVGDSVTSDNLQRKEKTKSCRRGKKKWMKVKKKKKRRKKQQWEAGSKKASTSANPRLRVRGRGSGGAAAAGTRGSEAHTEQGKAKARGITGIQDAHRAGLLPRQQRWDALKVRAASWLRRLGHGR